MSPTTTTCVSGCRRVTPAIGWPDTSFVFCAYVRTYHNQLQDFLSRETPAVVDAEMSRLGYLRLEAEGPWEDVLRRGYGRRVHAIPGVDGDDWQLAAQLAYRRDPGGGPDPPPASAWTDLRIVGCLVIGPE